MSQNLTTYPVTQMPEITSPNLLNSKIMTQLTTHCLNQSANSLPDSQLRITKVRWLTIFGGDRKLKSLSFKQFLLQWLRIIPLVAQKQASVTKGQFWKNMNVVNVSGSQLESLNHPYRVYLQIYTPVAYANENHKKSDYPFLYHRWQCL